MSFRSAARGSLAGPSLACLLAVSGTVGLWLGCTAEPGSDSASPSPAAPGEHSVAPPGPAAGSQAVAPAAVPALHLGIDVSHHSGEIDWQRVAAAGHTFAFVKATEGVDDRDPSFERNWAALAEAGLARGAYHFYVTEDDPEQQARFFLDTVRLAEGDLVPVVDLELIGHSTRPGLVDRVRRWLEIVEAEVGARPIIYTAPNFWDEHMDASFGDYPLWIAEYGVEQPRLPKGWSEWHLWQWQGDAQVPGIASGADLSHVNRDGPELSVLFVPDRG